MVGNRWEVWTIDHNDHGYNNVVGLSQFARWVIRVDATEAMAKLNQEREVQKEKCRLVKLHDEKIKQQNRGES